MNLHEQLMAAIAADKVDEAMPLIRSGLDLNSRCDQGTSALYGAILHGNASIVRPMLEHGADRDSDGRVDQPDNTEIERRARAWQVRRSA